MNFYEYFSSIVLTSYANFENKLRCKYFILKVLFLAFDFDKSNNLDMNEAKIIVLCFVTGKLYYHY